MDLIRNRTPHKQRWGGKREDFILAGPWGVLNRTFHSLKDINPYQVRNASAISV